MPPFCQRYVPTVLIGSVAKHSTIIQVLVKNKGLPPCDSTKDECKIIASLLTCGAKVNDSCSEGQTPLHMAVSKKCMECLETVLRFMPNLNKKNVYGLTALHVAIMVDFPRAIKLIMKCPMVDLSVRCEQGYNALHIAVLEDSIDVVKQIMSKKPRLAEVTSTNGYTPLHIAAAQGHKEIISVLLTTGRAGIDGRDFKNRTPLMIAAHENHSFTVKTILTFSPDINAQDSQGNTALHLAVLRNSLETMHLILDSSNVNVCIKNSKGYTPLHTAAENNNVIAVKKLLKATSLLIDTKNLAGFSALHLAVSNGHKEASEKLLYQGKANVNTTENENSTPLMVALHQGHSGLVEMLVENGANVNAMNRDGNTPLHIATALCKTPIQETGTSIVTPNAPQVYKIYKEIMKTDGIIGPNNYKNTLAIAAYLIQQGANPESRNNDGKTPFSDFDQLAAQRIKNDFIPIYKI